MAYTNNCPPGFSFPGQTMNMRPGGSPRFNQPCLWGSPRPERPNFSINRFMYPPHSIPKPDFVVDDIFGPNVPRMQHHEHFPFNAQNQHLPFNAQNQHLPFNAQNQHLPFNAQNQHLKGGGQIFQGQRMPCRGFMNGHGRGQRFQRSCHTNNSHGNQPDHLRKNKKKEKVNKRDLPESNAFYCDTCDRGFKTEDKFKEHVNGHTKCTYADCPFIAAPKLVQMHMNLQHRSGLAKKIWSIESEEDVNKWRDERKRNYPSAENIAKKLKEKEERLARGEVLQTKDFSKMKHGNGRGERGRGHGRDERGRGFGRGGRGRQRYRGRGRRQEWRDDNRFENGLRTREEHEGSEDDSPPEEIKNIQIHCQAENESRPLQEVMKVEDTPASSPPKHLESPTQAGSLALLAAYGESDSESDLDPVVAEKLRPESDRENGQLIQSGEILESHEPSAVNIMATTYFGLLPLKVNTSALSVSCAPPVLLPPGVAPSALSSPKSLPENSSSMKFSITTNANVANDSSGNEFANTTTFAKDNVGNSQSTNSKDISNTSASIETDPKAADGSRQNRLCEKKSSGTKREHDYENGRGLSHKKTKTQFTALPRKYTLLEKLLAPDIRRERNKILQCVHYIVKHRFFELEVTNGQEDSSAVTLPVTSINC